MDSLMFHPGPPCPALQRPAGGQPLKCYKCRFWGGPPAGQKACSRLLPFWTPHAYASQPLWELMPKTWEVKRWNAGRGWWGGSQGLPPREIKEWNMGRGCWGRSQGLPPREIKERNMGRGCWGGSQGLPPRIIKEQNMGRGWCGGSQGLPPQEIKERYPGRGCWDESQGLPP
jgi:hypothetical protein